MALWSGASTMGLPASPLGVLARDNQESPMNALASFPASDDGIPSASQQQQPMIVNTNNYNFK